ncbi:MAG: hypothetical protein ACR2M9_03895 [Cyanophyceae cyanobacterium]
MAKTDLAIDDPIVVAELQKKQIAVNKKNETVLPETNQPEPIQARLKKISIELTAPQEARLIREADSRQMTAKQFLQELVNERLTTNVGAAFITGPSYAKGPRVTGPTNNFNVSY